MVANRLYGHWLQRVRHDTGKPTCPDSTIVGNIMKICAVLDTNMVAGLASQRDASFALIEQVRISAIVDARFSVIVDGISG